MKMTVILNTVHQNGEVEVNTWKHQELHLVDITNLRKIFGAEVKPVGKGIISAIYEIEGTKQIWTYINE